MRIPGILECIQDIFGHMQGIRKQPPNPDISAVIYPKIKAEACPACTEEDGTVFTDERSVFYVQHGKSLYGIALECIHGHIPRALLKASCGMYFSPRPSAQRIAAASRSSAFRRADKVFPVHNSMQIW